MNVRFLGAHNCESSSTRLISILIDGTIALDAGSLTSSLTFAEQMKLQGVLLSHRHYDHIRDIPSLGINLYLNQASVDIYCTQTTCDTLKAHLFESGLYPDFLKRPEGAPTIRCHIITPGEETEVAGYTVLPLPVNHTAPTVGFQVRRGKDEGLFYTSDTGPGLAECWQAVSPQLLIIETSGSNIHEEEAEDGGHLIPETLKKELTFFREIRGYLPRVVTVHMSPAMENDIRQELAVVSREIGHPITPAHEGMEITL